MTTPQEQAGAASPTGASTFDLGELASVCAHYDVGEIVRVLDYPRGSRRAPKVVLDTSTGRYLLKRRARGKDDPYRVAFCHDLQLDLASRGFPAPRLIGTRVGNNSMVQLRDRVYELFEFVEGETFDRTPEPCRHAGALLCSLHGLAREYVSRWPVPVWSFHDDGLVRRRLERVLASGVAPAESRELWKLYQRAAAEASAVPAQGTAVQLLHGDWHPGNMVFRAGRVVAVVDFDGARMGPVLHDLAAGVMQFSMARVGLDPDAWPDALDANRFAAFVAGYRPGPAGLDALAALMAEALIAELAGPVANTGTFAGREAAPFVRMTVRKTRWLLQHSEALARLATKSARGR
ncbi:MAG: phosphotransferase [Phycisphaerales bacterium]|nr:phosphotransferase [Phycisphaerales bacterium]